MALTDAVARQARITGKAYTLNDSDGLSLFVTANGAKKWHFRFSLQGKQQRISLGSYPALSLKQARQQRDELRAQLASGVDPRGYRQQSNAAAQNTFDAVFRQWRDFKALSLESRRQSTLSQIDRIFAKDVLPSLGGLSIFDVEPSYILAVLRRIEQRKAFTTTEKVRTWLNQLFRYAKVEKGVRYNPASDLDIVAALRPPVTHNPFLRMDELPTFLCTLHNEMAAVRVILRAAGRAKLADAERLSNKALGLSGTSRDGTRQAITPERYRAVLAILQQKDAGLALMLQLARMIGLRSQEAVQCSQSLKTWATALERGDEQLTVVFGIKGGRPRQTRVLDREALIQTVTLSLEVVAARNGRLIDKSDLKSAINRWRSQTALAGLKGQFSPHSLRYAWAQDAIRHYRQQGFSNREARSLVSMDLGHGDGRRRYVLRVYGKSV